MERPGISTYQNTSKIKLSILMYIVYGKAGYKLQLFIRITSVSIRLFITIILIIPIRWGNKGKSLSW